MPVKELPSALEAEASLLGTLLLYPGAMRKAIGAGLLEDDFFSEINKTIFLAIKAIYDEGKEINLASVSTYLKDEGNYERVGGHLYLTDLMEASVSNANTVQFVEIIKDKAIQRSLIEVAEEIARRGYEGQTSVADYLDSAERDILGVSRRRRGNSFNSSSELFTRVFDKITKMAKDRTSITGIETGYKILDSYTHGFQRGDLIILAARPSMGKTAVGLNLALQVAERNRDQGAVAIFSMEMPAESIGFRLLSAKSRVNGDKLKTGYGITKTEWNEIHEAIVDLKGLKLYVDESTNLKVSDIFSQCNSLKLSNKGLALVVVDYIQLIQGNSNGRDFNRQQEVAEISRGLKRMARELSVPVIALAQLSRNVEQRENKVPMLSDLRESGAIEQDADLVMMLYRESYYNSALKEAVKETGTEPIDIIIAKHRNGETGRFSLAFEPTTNFCFNISQTATETPGEGNA